MDTAEHIAKLWEVLHAYRETGALTNDEWDEITYSMVALSEAAELATDDSRSNSPHQTTQGA